MTQKFFSKEVHFLKADSDDAYLKPPKFFFSDLLLDKTDRVKRFEKRLTGCEIPGENFLCAVIYADCRQDEGVEEKANTAFEETFNAFLDHKRGIWETLSHDAFILAFWDFDSHDKAIPILKSIQEKLAGTLKTDILVGVATFPFHQFEKEQIPANALKAIDHAAFFGPSTLFKFDAVSINICADRLYQLGKFDLAIAEYEKGLAIAPRDANLMNSLGVCYGVMDDLTKAKAQFKKARKATPNDAMIIYNIGLIYMIEDDIDNAVIYLRKAHATDERIFEIELLLGQLLFKSGHFNQALPHLESATGLKAESGLAFRYMGEIYLEQGEPEKAALKFNTAIKCNPSDAVSLSGYAKCLEMQDKNLQIALTFAKNSVNMDPGNKLFEERLASIIEKLGMSDIDENSAKTA